MTKDHILQFENLSKTFKQDLFKKPQIAVNGVNCGFRTGACTGFIGHNGAGKTTSIKMVFGLIHPTEGRVLFKGNPIKNIDKKLIGYMPETNKLPKMLNSEEILKYHLKSFKPKGLTPRGYNDRIEGKLREVGLLDHRKKRVANLSKGMGRRLAWAQATIHDPELIILDEPFSGLDPIGRHLIAELIEKLKSKNVSIILCTHELWSVEALCNDVHILNNGKLVYSSSLAKDEIENKANFELTIGFDTKKESFIAKSGLPSPITSHPRGSSTRLEFDSYQTANQWLIKAIELNIPIQSFSRINKLSEEELLPHFEGQSA